MNVAFMVYRRPDLARRVFEVIASARPSRLLVVADGPKDEAESVLCAETRRVIEGVDWPCEVLTNFADSNMGCRKRISTGIDWVFSQVEDAIIVEDDCLPHPTFFQYCQDLLERYRDDERIADIAGEYGLPGHAGCKESYFASRYGSIWGWATWRRAWSLYDVEMRAWPEFRDRNRHADFVYGKAQADLMVRRFDEIHCGNVDTWDLQWGFARMLHGVYSLVPSVNLVTNIGFREDASRTVADSAAELANRAVEAMEFPLTHPSVLVPRDSYDRAYLRSVALRLPPLWQRIGRNLTNKHMYGTAIRGIPGVGNVWTRLRNRTDTDANR